MFLDGLTIEETKQFQKDCEDMSKYWIAGIHKYQMSRAHVDGEVTVHVIYAAAMFALGVVIKDLHPRQRRQIKDFMIAKFDDFMKEHGRPA